MGACISRSGRRVWRLAGAGLLVLAPRSALACPVCGFVGVNENWTVYLAMTAMLSALPLLMIGGMVFWLSRRARLGASFPVAQSVPPGATDR